VFYSVSFTSTFRIFSKAQTGGVKGGLTGGVRGGLTGGLPKLNLLIHKALIENTGGLERINIFCGKRKKILASNDSFYRMAYMKSEGI
jgi:hypothetical protein